MHSSSIPLNSASADYYDGESRDSLLSARSSKTKNLKKFLLLATIASVLGVSIYFIVDYYFKHVANNNEDNIPDDPNPLVNFLMKSIPVIKDLNNHGAKIPTSFFIDDNYLLYLCHIENCITNGNLNINLQTERILMKYGQDIYDAATWQIAMALAGKFDLAYNQLNFLNAGHTADANPLSTLRATSDIHKLAKETFTYGVNRTYITEAAQAYFFRMLGPQFFNLDPLAGQIGIPEVSGQNWSDWKPITGEVAWAGFIGPLQLAIRRYLLAEYVPLTELLLQHNLMTAVEAMQSPLGGIYYSLSDVSPNQGDGRVNPYSISLENNFSLLSGINMYREILESHRGEYFVDGTKVDAEITRVNKIINKMLYFIKNYAFDSEHGYFYQGGLANDPSQKSTWLPTVEPFALDVQTWGMTVLGVPTIDSWFGNGTAYKIWQKAKAQAGYYGVNGDTSQPIQGVGFSNQPAPINGSSINVNVTNQDQGNHNLSVYALWQDSSTPLKLTNNAITFGETLSVTIPMRSAQNCALAGVQFLDENYAQVAVININANSTTINDNAEVNVSWNNAAVTFNNYAPDHSVLSAEWTYGAINMAQSLAEQYAQLNQTAYADDLLNDVASMEQGVLCLSSKNYLNNTNCHATIPQSAGVVVPVNQTAMLYANRRYLIPFGWEANPIPSTCATSWNVMLEKDFNPFALNGTRQAINWLATNEKNVQPIYNVNTSGTFFNYQPPRLAQANIDAELPFMAAGTGLLASVAVVLLLKWSQPGRDFADWAYNKLNNALR